MLLASIRALPTVRREGRGGDHLERHAYPPGLGAVLLRLAHNRHLTPSGTAKALYAVTAGHVYLAASTIAGVGHGGVRVTPELLAAFADLLGIPAADLAALGGLPLPDGSHPAHPRDADLAALIWAARRLTTAQLGEVEATARRLAGR
ncbi:hypothetical protein ACIRBX_23400 [Kitasatospora sp. NPDC096147]|uniref:hypothetical protein n=1 Tax=Kitasatospora sp. NPDC096147 TaxID=3364093 RepID=UPI0037FF08DC